MILLRISILQYILTMLNRNDIWLLYFINIDYNTNYFIKKFGIVIYYHYICIETKHNALRYLFLNMKYLVKLENVEKILK